MILDKKVRPIINFLDFFLNMLTFIFLSV
jgi:hypothetical protein